LSKQRPLKKKPARGRKKRNGFLQPSPEIMDTANQIKRNSSPEADENELPLAGGKGAAVESAGNVDKIRDILFGSQMRDYEKKFSRVEERQAREVTELRDEIKRRFASLEAFVKGELTAVTDQLKSDKAERVEADKELARELKETSKALEKKLAQMEEQTAKSLRDLRQQVLDESKRLTEEMEQKQKEQGDALETEGELLRATLTDRLALADLFAEVALRLKNEFKVPAKK
jgi:hypothetical protein